MKEAINDLEQILLGFEQDYHLMAEVIYKTMAYISSLHLKETDLSNAEKTKIIKHMNAIALERIRTVLLKGDF